MITTLNRAQIGMRREQLAKVAEETSSESFEVNTRDGWNV